MKKLGLLVLILCTFTVMAFAEDPNQGIYDKVAQALADASAAGDNNPEAAKEAYARAASLYTKLINNGVKNDKIYYNLGNCYFQMDEFPLAILQYRKALVYMPGDENTEANIIKAKQMLRNDDPELKDSGFFDKIVSFNSKIPLYAKEYFSDISWVLFWGGLVGFLYLRKKVDRKKFLIIAVIWWLCLVSISLLSYLASTSADGVVLTPEVTARKGDGDNYAEAFTKPLKAGTEFKVLETRGDWIKVELATGNKCWLKSGDVGLVKEEPTSDTQN